jgi:hypothetical protein
MPKETTIYKTLIFALNFSHYSHIYKESFANIVCAINECDSDLRNDVTFPRYTWAKDNSLHPYIETYNLGSFKFSINFFFFPSCDGPIKLANCHPKKKTKKPWERPHLINRTNKLLKFKSIFTLICIYLDTKT